MNWYDFFASFYDRSLETLFAEARRETANRLNIQPDSVILDLPCGTGQSFQFLQPFSKGNSKIIAIDYSQGMLNQAKKKALAKNWNNVSFIQSDVCLINTAEIRKIIDSKASPSMSKLAVNQDCEEPIIDRLHCFLGMSTFPDMYAAFSRMWSLLKPGGRFVVLDTYSENLSLQGRMVNLVACADIRRLFWKAIRPHCKAFEKISLPASKKHGGQLILCYGTKPRS